MNPSGFLVEAAIYLSAAVLAVPLFKRFGLGSVLGYLLAGILIGPYAFKLIGDPEQVLHFAEFGVVLLLFLVGLELEPDKVWELRKRLFGLGGLQVGGTIALVVTIAMLVGLPWVVALVAGIGIAMSSTAIGLASLEERRLLRTPGGQASFAVLLFQDLSVVPLFMLLALLAPGGTGAVDPWAIAKALAVVVAIILASRTVLRPIMRVVAETGMREIFFAFSLLLVIGVSIAVQAVGLSLVLVLVKGALLYGLGRLFRLASRDALLFAVGLSQVGEFAFVIFGIGLSQGSLDRDTYNALNAIVAVSMLTTPLLLALYDRYAGLKLAPPEDDAIKEENPVIVAGFGRFGQIVGRVLLAHGIPATLIDKDPNQVALMRSFGWRCYYGDASRLDLLQQAGIAKARLFVIAVDDPHAALETARLVKERWPEAPVVARARSRTDAFDFRELDIDPIRETYHSALEAARQALVALKISASGAARIIRQFERHDQEMIERTLNVRHDREALMSVVEQGRQDLEALLAAERGDLEEDELVIR